MVASRCRIASGAPRREDHRRSWLPREVEVPQQVPQDRGVLPDVRAAIGTAVRPRVDPRAAQEVVLDELQVCCQGPGTEVHRRERLEDAEHVMKTFGPAQVRSQERRAGNGRQRGQVEPISDVAAVLRRTKVLCKRGGHVRAPRDSTQPKVRGNLPRPHRSADDGIVVVTVGRLPVHHRRPPKTRAATSANPAPTAALQP